MHTFSIAIKQEENSSLNQMSIEKQTSINIISNGLQNNKEDCEAPGVSWQAILGTSNSLI